MYGISIAHSHTNGTSTMNPRNFVCEWMSGCVSVRGDVQLNRDDNPNSAQSIKVFLKYKSRLRIYHKMLPLSKTTIYFYYTPPFTACNLYFYIHSLRNEGKHFIQFIIYTLTKWISISCCRKLLLNVVEVVVRGIWTFLLERERELCVLHTLDRRQHFHSN